MLRLILIFIAVYCLTSCTSPDYQQMRTATGQLAAAKARLLASKYFLKKYAARVDLVLAGLAAEDGFLDNPLVKILLPPPVGLLIDVGQTFYENPRAALLDTLINHAAEQVTLGAGPVLRHAMEGIILENRAEALLSGDETAVTDFLRQETAAALHQTLLPEVSSILEDSGAKEIYRELTEVAAKVEKVNSKARQAEALLNGEIIENRTNTPLEEKPVNLDTYVTENAVAGIFKMLGEEEKALRQQLTMGGNL